MKCSRTYARPYIVRHQSVSHMHVACINRYTRMQRTFCPVWKMNREFSSSGSRTRDMATSTSAHYECVCVCVPTPYVIAFAAVFFRMYHWNDDENWTDMENIKLFIKYCLRVSCMCVCVCMSLRLSRRSIFSAQSTRRAFSLIISHRLKAQCYIIHVCTIDVHLWHRDRGRKWE